MKKLLKWILVGFVSLFVLGMIIEATKSPEQKAADAIRRAERDAQRAAQRAQEEKKVDEGDVHGAWAYMQQFVQRQLKSPRSAQFPFGGHRHVTPLGGGRYEVQSYVDAQNSFGATIRTNFKGVIRRVKGGWELEYIDIDE